MDAQVSDPLNEIATDPSQFALALNVNANEGSPKGTDLRWRGGGLYRGAVGRSVGCKVCSNACVRCIKNGSVLFLVTSFFLTFFTPTDQVSKEQREGWECCCCCCCCLQLPLTFLLTYSPYPLISNTGLLPFPLSLLPF